MDKLTKTLIAAVVASFVLVFGLMAIIYSATTGTGSNVTWILQFLALLTMTASAIVWWVRYLRGYVDSAIERKLREIDKQEPN
ncbi:MAG: hypothetical protein OEW48_12690 [Phycisphaerae bacterium]|nr:hypothetical protein [Phycisphaerae bacterium]